MGWWPVYVWWVLVSWLARGGGLELGVFLVSYVASHRGLYVDGVLGGMVCKCASCDGEGEARGVLG